MKKVVIGVIIGVVAICIVAGAYFVSKHKTETEAVETVVETQPTAVNAAGETIVSDGITAEEMDLVSKILTDHAPDLTMSYTVVALTRDTLTVADTDGNVINIPYDITEYEEQSTSCESCE